MPTKRQLSQQQEQHPHHHQNTDAERHASEDVQRGATSRRLEDRIALFFQGLERSSCPNVEAARPTTALPAIDVADSERLPRSTADPVHTQPQVFVLLNDEKEGGLPRLPSNGSAMSQPQKRLEKRIRRDAPSYEEAVSNLSGPFPTFGVGELLGRARLRTLATTPVTTSRPVQHNDAIIHQAVPDASVAGGAAISLPSVGPGQTMIDVRVLSHYHPVDFKALTTVSSVASIPPASNVHPPGSSSEQTSDASKMSAIDKAKLDWETHITAMEQVLAANREQGLPNQSISLDALQLLSQMVSNLYALNAKLLYAETQRVLDEHRQNAKRIDDVFQGLAGVKKQQSKDD